MTHDSRLPARLRGSLVGGALLLLASAAPTPSLAQQVPTDFTAIVKQRMPAVVAVTTRQRVEERQQRRNPLPTTSNSRTSFAATLTSAPALDSNSRGRGSGRAS